MINKNMKKLFKITALLTLAFILPVGCSGLKGTKPTIKEESLQIVELKKSLSQVNMRLEELNNKFLLLQEKVESNKQKISELGGSPQSAKRGNAIIKASSDSEVPENLKIVRLKSAHSVKKKITKSSTKHQPTPEGLYNRGQNLFLSGKYANARAVFEELVKRFPRHTLADNALYWSGETYYSTERYEEAVMKFTEAADRYPGENKAPDALLKAGFSYIELGKTLKGTTLLTRLSELYPESEASDKAKKKLLDLVD